MGCIAVVWCMLVLPCGLAGVVWYPYAGWSLHTDTTPPQPNHNVTPTYIKPQQYNPRNNSTNKSQAPEDGCINIRNMLSIKWRNNKASDIKLVSLYSSIKMMVSRWCGIRMQAEAIVLQPAYGYHTTPPQPNHKVTPTHIEPEQYNPRNNTTNKSQAPEDGCINIRNMLSIK